MKSLNYFLKLIVIMIVMVAAPHAFAFTGTGAGTSNDPYVVTTCVELQSLDTLNSYDKYAILANDIDCSTTATWNEDPGNPGTYFGFLPLPTLYGNFNGQGHTISNLTIHRTPNASYTGLFSIIGSGGIVYNLKFTNATVTSSQSYTGLLTGQMYGAAVGVTATGSVSSIADNVGGLVGHLQSYDGIMRSSFSGTVTGHNFVGGLTGYMVNASIQDSYANTTINGASYVGGVSGYLSNCCTSIARSYAAGAATASNGYVGGLAGYVSNGNSDMSITDSFASVTLSAGFNLGQITSSFGSLGIFTGNYYDSTKNIGELCIAIDPGSHTCSGQTTTAFYSHISAPLNTWDFTSIWQEHTSDFPTLRDANDLSAPSVPQALTMSATGINLHVSWSAPATTGGVPIRNYTVQVKKSTDSWSGPLVADAQTSNTTYDVDSDNVDLGATYDVRVKAQNLFGESAYTTTTSAATTPDAAVHTITTCQQLQDMDQNTDTFGDVFKLGNDIDCSGIIDFRPIGSYGSQWTRSFRGIFDGQHHTISNLTINKPGDSNVGLFSEAYRATFKDVTLTGGTITGREQVGALLGYGSNDAIVNVHSDLSVNGNYQGWAGGSIGGLVGVLESYGSSSSPTSVSNSSSSGAHSGSQNVGGIIGYLYEYPDSYGYNPEITVTGNNFTGTIVPVVGGNNDAFGGIIGTVDLENENDNDSIITLTVANNTVSTNLITGNEEIGGIIGNFYSYIEYTNTHTNVDVSGNSVESTINADGGSAGGVVGYMESSIDDTNEHFNYTMNNNAVAGIVHSSATNVGGLVGYMGISNDYQDSRTDQSTNHNQVMAIVSGSGYVGGLVGYYETYQYGGDFHTDEFTKNFVTGTVTGQGSYVGGLFGYIYNDSHIVSMSDSYVNTTVTGASGYVGGIAGSLSGGQYMISRVYAAGSVDSNGNENVGGLIGYTEADQVVLTKSFAANMITGSAKIGAVVGYDNSSGVSLADVYFDYANSSTECVNGATASGCTAVNTMENQDANYFINNSTNAPMGSPGQGDTWDFTNVWFTEPLKYPQLRVTAPVGDVTAPVINELTPIPAQLTGVTQAVYHFTSTEAGTPSATNCGYGSIIQFEDIASTLSDSRVTISNLTPGHTYSCSFTITDSSNNVSNQLMIGPFTVNEAVTQSTSSVGSYRGMSKSWTPVTQVPQQNTPAQTSLTRSLKQGVKNAQVLVLQQLLNKKGFIIAKTGAGSPDNESSLFGVKTKLAVIKFQKQNKLKADGIVGTKTWLLLNK